MAKNYRDIYESENVAISLEQRYYVKEETTRGELIAPTDTDFIFTLAGGSVDFTQPYFSSPHRSGRHHNSPIRQKKETSWSLPTYFNIDTTQVAPAAAELDLGIRLLWKSLMGFEDAASGLLYKPTTPDLSFSMFEVGDKMAKQTRGCFVESATLNFPGDGEAQADWSGNAKDVIYVGIGKSSVLNDGGNTITLDAGDGAQFLKSAGGLVMLVKGTDGVTRSTDTPNGSPRKILDVTGDVVTVDGTILADADGSGTAIYLCYYEPETPTAIDNPVTGLTGSLSITGYTGAICPRNISLTLGNEHELINYCYGEDSLAGKLYVPGSRFTAAISMEINLDKSLFEFFHKLQDFQAQELQVILGDSSDRHLDIDIPRAVFETPTIPVPENGSIPVTFDGTAYQTALGAGDEISVHFK